MSDDEQDVALVPDATALQEAINAGGEPTAAPATPTAEDNQTTDESNGTGSDGANDDGQKPPEDDSKPGEDDGGQTGRPEKRSRAEQRIGALTGKLREKDEYIESLQRELDGIQRQSTVKPPTPDEDGNITVDQMMEYNRQQAEAIARDQVSELQRGLEGEQVASRFDREESDILQAYPMLNPNNASLDPSDPNAYNEKLAQAVFGHIQDTLSPHLTTRNIAMLAKISPKAIADSYMEGAMALAAAERERAVTSVQAINGQSSGLFDSDAAPSMPTTKRDPMLSGFDSTA